MKRIDTMLIASGGGTDADSIMQAYISGFIPNINLKGLISTKRDAGCLEKAAKLGIHSMLIERKGRSLDNFNKELSAYLKQMQVQLIFLVGCVVKAYPINGIVMYNIHPAHLHKHGGDQMYGLEVHRRVLREIKDKIQRGRKTLQDKFFTYPTIHEATMDYDAGESLLIGCIEIPQRIVHEYTIERIDTNEAAARLQKHVLPYEWLMLPTAVLMAAKKILDNKKREVE